MQNLIVDPEFFIENMDVLPSIPVCRFVCKNGKENTALMMKLANYFEIYKLLAFRVEKSYFASIIRALKHQTQSYNKYMGMSHTLQTVHNNRAHPSIIKFYIHWQKTWISGFSCKSKLVPSATFSSRQPTFLGSYEYTYSFSVSSH